MKPHPSEVKRLSLEDDRRNMAIALTGAVAISFSPIIYSLSGVEAGSAAFFRMLYALPLLAVIAWRVRGADNRGRRTRWIAVGAGVILGPDMFAYHYAIDMIGAGLSTLIGNSQVIIVTLMSWLLFKERPNKAIFASIPIVLFGVYLMSGVGDESAYGVNPRLGVIMSIIGAFAYSSFLILFRYANRELAPAPSLLFDATLGATASLFLLSFGSGNFEMVPTWPGHAWILLLALLAQVLGWIAIAHALPRLPGSLTSFAILLQPTLSFIWGILILAEEPSSQQMLGVVAVVAGILAVTLFGSVSDQTST